MRGMRIGILVAALLAVVQIVAGGASASVRFDPATNAGFIGRGDVITLLGKDALRPTAAILARYRMDWQLDCHYADGTTARVSASSDGYVLMLATARRATNGTITGYVLPGVLLDSDLEPRPDQLCFEADGAGPGPLTVDVVDSQRVEVGLWFNGVRIPA